MCHICGKAYSKLGNHIRFKHQMTMKEYKEKYGICNRTKMTSENYQNKMQEIAERIDSK